MSAFWPLPPDFVFWLQNNFLEMILWILGGMLAARAVGWAGGKITGRIDRTYQQTDALVRTEAAKHRHSVAQVVTWVVVALIYVLVAIRVLQRLGFPITSLVAPATVLGAALGFGAQRIVQDILSGFFIITERQYGYGDVVQLAITGTAGDAIGTVEDVTLRVTRVRSAEGEVITVPNGQIVKAVNLSKDWARAVIDVPVPPSADLSRVTELLKSVGEEAYRDGRLTELLLDEPTVMGVESIEVDQVNLRLVARTLPGKQFEVGRELRARIALTLRNDGITVSPELSADRPVGGEQ
ncbi:mechanosensitive ion channel protein MscS [Rhodococcus sp. Leaf225]|nr:mechanosensitive ion channel protein MscS [Rhodococcus sp. Leaf225]KQU41541.1 mechanosensitive ion channel protein MscS [Rhodococcus sp. Leaf258]MDQ1201985.1 small-conductance mechanosensitive channel [Rhodococcus sp. SORGH_AS_0303]